MKRRGTAREVAHRAARKSAFDIAEELGVVGRDDDPRRDVAKNHSRYVKRALRGKRSA